MSYREKTAWLALVAMAVSFGPYFFVLASNIIPTAGLPNTRHLMLFGATAAMQALVLGIGYWYLRRTAAQDTRVPPDERDKAIEYRATSSAYYVLIAGMIVVGCVLPFTASGWRIVHATIAMIVTAQIVNYGIVVFSYRRQA